MSQAVESSGVRIELTRLGEAFTAALAACERLYKETLAREKDEVSGLGGVSESERDSLARKAAIRSFDRQMNLIGRSAKGEIG